MRKTSFFKFLSNTTAKLAYRDIPYEVSDVAAGPFNKPLCLHLMRLCVLSHQLS